MSKVPITTAVVRLSTFVISPRLLARSVFNVCLCFAERTKRTVVAISNLARYKKLYNATEDCGGGCQRQTSHGTDEICFVSLQRYISNALCE